MSPRITLIANPAAGNGRGARRLPAARAAFALLGATVRVTERAGDEARLAREAVENGADVVVALGGDGTWGRVAGAVVDAGSNAAVAFLAAGSGNDFVKTLGTPAHDAAAMAAFVEAGRSRAIDVGRAGEVTFLNSAGFAFDAAVLDLMRRSPLGGGALSYALASLRILFGYPGIDVRVGDGPFARQLALVFANGRHFGGSFVIAPGAELADGALDIVTIAPLAPLARLGVFAACTRGAHLGRAGVATSARALTRLAFPAPPLFQADGELHQARATELEVRCLAGALRVVA